MNLLKVVNIVNNSLNLLKKSICQLSKFDVFLLLVIIILILSPPFLKRVFKSETGPGQIYLSLSMLNGEFFSGDTTEKLIQEFNEKNPDIIIRLVTDDPTADILIFDELDADSLFTSGALAKLPAISPATLSENIPSELPAESTGEKEYLAGLAIPLVSFMDLLFYNIEILTDAGFGHPPRSRDEFLAYARTVSRKNSSAGKSITGTALSLCQNDKQAISRDIFSWIWAAGGNFFPGENSLLHNSSIQSSSIFVTPLSTPPVFNTRAMINDITFLGTLNREGLLAPEIFETSGKQRIEEFAQGQIAMMIASTQSIPYLRERMGDETFGITTIPHPGTGGRYNISVSSIYAGINSNFQNSDVSETLSLQMLAALRFLNFLAEKSSLFSVELNAVPGSVFNVIPGDYIRQDPFYSKAWDIFDASQIVQSFCGKLSEYETAFLEELRVFFESNRTAQQTAAAIHQRWDLITNTETNTIAY